MSDIIEAVIQPSPYGLVRKYKRFGVVFISVVTFLLCVSSYPHWDFDYELREPPDEPTAPVSLISNHADVLITATPAYSAPSE
jgi:hypothetical protein